MKKKLFVVLGILIVIILSIYFINYVNSKHSNMEENKSGDENILQEEIKINIKIGNHSFMATLEKNKTTEELIKMFPITINMKDHLSNEKFYDLPNSLPTNDYNPKKINIGDLMLFGSKTLVLFYDSFDTSYNYTRLGKINDITNLVLALGSNYVTVTIELDN